MKSVIPIESIHICSIDCAKTFKMKPNKKYDIKTGQCDKYGISESIAIKIATKYNINKVINLNHIVIIDNDIEVEISYPLKTAVRCKGSSSSGWTRIKLINFIIKTYKKIYKDEYKSSKIKIIPIKKRIGLENRNTTDGIYGIWGHDITDLFIEGIEYDKNNKVVTLSIGS